MKITADYLMQQGLGAPPRLLRQLVEMKLAAAEVEGVCVLREFFAECFREGINALLTVFFDFEQAGFFEDTEVLGDVVGCDVQGFTQLGDRFRACDEETH